MTHRKSWHSNGNLVRREELLPMYLRRTGERNRKFRLEFDFSRDFSYQPLINDKVLTLKMNLGYFDETKAKLKRLIERYERNR